MPDPKPLDRIQGSLELLILKTVLHRPMHGWGIAHHILASSREALRVNQGALYPALHRLEERGWVVAEWGLSDANRRARYYHATAEGRKQFRKETQSWIDFVHAVQLVLQLEPA